MKRIPIVSFVVPIVTLISVLSFVLSPLSAYADAKPPAGYDIEVQMLHCINPHKPCNTPATARNSIYTQVEAVSFHPGRIEGTPDAVDFTCGYAYLDKNGVVHDVAQHVFAGYEPGTIRGMAELEKAYTERSTWAKSEIDSITAHDNVTGDTATVSGEMVSNNVTDLRVRGGFQVEIHGPIYDEYMSNGKMVSKKIGHGEFECSTYGSYVSAPFASGPFFEGVLGQTDND